MASAAHVSNGLISRIENGRTIPSLPVLLEIVSALDVNVPEFFNGIPKRDGNKFLVIRKGESSPIEKEIDARGFHYEHIFGKQLPSIGFDAVLLTIEPGSVREQVVSDAYEFKYILSGQCTYVIEKDSVTLNEGDSIFFDGRYPHVPINRGNINVQMLVIYFFMDA